MVITIIVLLILAGISIATLTGENGILTKANTAKEEHKIAQYREELNLIILEEVTEREVSKKEEPMIESLDKKIKKKDWVEKTSRENEEGASEEYLIVQSKEGYEFIIEVNEEKETAKIIQESKTPGEKYTITYEPNGGNGQPETVEVRNGFSKILKNNTYTREDYSFVGWCEKEEPDEETKPYLEGSRYQPKGNVTLYAIWSYDIATITFNANTGTGSMESKKVTKQQDSTLPVNTFTKENYDFVKWNTKADGTGKDYENSSTINITEDITLYAIWKVSIKAVLKIDASATTEADRSPYVKYNGLNCRVLYNDDTHGIQIITDKSVGNVALGYDDSMVTASDFTYTGGATINNNFKKAAASYNNVVDNLNKRAKSYMDTKEITTDARCLGSSPTLTNNTKFQGDTTSNMWSGSYTYLTTYAWNGKFKNADTNYSQDVNRLKALKLNGSSGYTWLASRYIRHDASYARFIVYSIYSDGTINQEILGNVSAIAGGSTSSYNPTCGFRPIFLLSSDVIIKSGDGTSGNPYVIEK